MVESDPVDCRPTLTSWRNIPIALIDPTRRLLGNAPLSSGLRNARTLLRLREGLDLLLRPIVVRMHLQHFAVVGDRFLR